MRPPRILFYADMEALIPHCVAAAEMLRSKLGAHIIMMVYDAKTYYDKAFENYELYDHGSLFRLSGRYVAIKPPRVGSVSQPTAAGGGSSDAGDASAPRPGVGAGESLQVDAGGPVSADTADAAGHGDIGPGQSSEAGRPAKLSGLRRFLARSKKLKEANWALVVRMDLFFRHSFIGQVFVQSVNAWRRRICTRRFLRAMKPDAIILAEDNVERLSTTLINEGYRQRIPGIIIPFTIPNPLEPATSYRDRKLNQLSGPLARLVCAIYPKWRFRIDGRDLIRVPAFTALVLELLGQSSPAPWVLNRGRAARIGLDSEALRDLYLGLGFPAAQLRVVGDVNGETLHQASTNKSRLLPELLASHGFLPDRPLILCGFPPNQFGSEADHFEFSDYEALIEGWMASFRALGDRANVLVRPHPRVAIDRLEAFGGPNLRFTLQPTAELIPLCDLYVASISATIRWAIACGVPVINYDTYRYRYGDYDKAAGVIAAESLADFQACLARFVNDPWFAADLAVRQKGAMRYWGVIDDKLAERFAAFVSEVISESRVGSSS